jgi:hypothetical protein
MAGLIIPATHSACNGIPPELKSTQNHENIFLDTGILLQRILGLSIGDLPVQDDFETTKSGNAELFVIGAKKRLPYENQDLYFWHREAKVVKLRWTLLSKTSPN